MGEFPVFCELLKGMAGKLWAIVRYKSPWDSVSSKLLFAGDDDTVRRFISEGSQLPKVREVVHDDQIVGIALFKEIRSKSAPRLCWNFMCHHWFLWLLWL